MKRALACLTLLVAANGCVAYRLVERTPEGGTYALLGDPAEAMTEVRPQMESHCGGPVKVVKEGEVAIGEISQSQSGTKRRGSVTFGSSTTETTQKTEWRVEYRCKAEEPAAEEASEEPEGRKIKDKTEDTTEE